MTDTPHFDLPLRLKGTSMSVVEQDSVDDIANCVAAAIKTEIGSRKELPTFGTTDLTFKEQPLNVQGLVEEILLHEPRANILIDQNPERFNQLVVSVALHVSAKQEDVVR